MEKPLSELLVEVANSPDPKPYLFEVGQKVRVKKEVLEDGQTPQFWVGTIVEVLSRHATMFHKEHYYVLLHENGAKDKFKEYELDLRFCKKV